jgi:hypothetical protein
MSKTSHSEADDLRAKRKEIRNFKFPELLDQAMVNEVIRDSMTTEDYDRILARD